MSQMKLAHVSGRDHYDAIYRDQLANEAEWLDRTARHKADSIEHLIRKNGIARETMLELGCGTGSVIRECQRRGLARSYIAVDYSETAIEYLRAHSVDIETHIADVTDAELAFDRPVDVVVLSHLIEHLEEPHRFLESLQGINFRYLIAEVPLDDLLMGRLAALTKKDRTQNLAGHVQFFTARSFDTLLASSGLEVLDRRRYLPTLDMDTIRFVCRKNGSSRATYLKMVLGRYLRAALGPLWSTFFSAHYAVLAKVAPGSPCVQRLG
jgi:SAM-dependent methyltransferase